MPTPVRPSYSRSEWFLLGFTNEAFVPRAIQVDYSILDGPGAHLTNGIFLGDTVARETFVTQFVQDISSAASISPSRVLVMEIAPGWVHHDWEVKAFHSTILWPLGNSVKGAFH